MENYYRLNSDAIYTVDEVAKILRISSFSVRRLIHGGYIKASKRGRSFTIYGNHLIEYVNKDFIERKTI